MVAMELNKELDGAEALIKTSVGEVTANFGGQSFPPYVPLTVRGQDNCSGSGRNWVIASDPDCESEMNPVEGADNAPGNIPIKKIKENKKVLNQYKMALKIKARLDTIDDLSLEDKHKLAWAEQMIEANPKGIGPMPEVHNENNANVEMKVKEHLKKVKFKTPLDLKTPRSSLNAKMKTRAFNRVRNKKLPTKRHPNVAKEDLVVAIINRKVPSGKLSLNQWQLVELNLLNMMVRSMGIPNSLPATFEDAGWENGVKLISCRNDYTLKWLSQTVSTMDAPWPEARLDVVNKKWIPTLMKAKVTLPHILPKDQSLKLLKWQNPDVPTNDWQVVNVKPDTKGQKLVLKISKEAKDLLTARRGKMAWGMGTVRVHVKKPHNDAAMPEPAVAPPPGDGKDLSSCTTLLPLNHNEENTLSSVPSLCIKTELVGLEELF